MRYLFLALCLALCSCPFKDVPIGTCPPIELSKEEILFDAQENNDSIYVKDGANWWLLPNEPDYCSGSYCNDNKNNIMKIEGAWFSAVKINEHAILISVKQNNAKQKRNHNIYIAGNYSASDEAMCYGNVSITQSAD